jgi:uncharacterized membrane protein YoaK (UPF0700 family)
MEVQKSNIAFLTMLLAAVAGYCDTTTFVAAKEIFSAHVTGNFIVFAYQLVKGGDASALLKLLTFPVFIIAVIIGGKITNQTSKKYLLLLIQGIILTLAGLAVYVLQRTGVYFDGWPMYTCTMFVVFAMGLQNAFGKLFGKETFGPTTMMTGNVTQAALDIGDVISTSAPHHTEASGSLRKQAITITGFLIGCILGALLGKGFGLMVVGIPGVILIACYVRMTRKSVAI